LSLLKLLILNSGRPRGIMRRGILRNTQSL